jgi:uncharacterized protein YnzC (UPF0291/DUF896 family)
MEFSVLLNRINELSRLAKTRELSAVEKNEREELRKEYIKVFKSNFKAQLDNIEIVDEEKIN